MALYKRAIFLSGKINIFYDSAVFVSRTRMHKILTLVCILIPSMALADGYWERIITMAQKHPSFEAMRSVELSSQSLGDIEKARRFPVVSGTLSRVDGSSTLTQTSDAI